jgi:hypothetical protein
VAAQQVRQLGDVPAASHLAQLSVGDRSSSASSILISREFDVDVLAAAAALPACKWFEG